MKLGIMQPYFFPYIGYFQLINAVDRFLLYENVSFRKKSWIHRNFILPKNSAPLCIHLPVSQRSSFKRIGELEIETSGKWKTRFLKTIALAYSHAPHYGPVSELIERILTEDHTMVHLMNAAAVGAICRFLEIGTVLSCDHHHYLDLEAGLDRTYDSPSDERRELPVDKKTARILALCKAESATLYVNPIGGTTLYDKADFLKESIELRFLHSGPVQYRQFGSEFTPNLSIIDVLMHCGKDGTRALLQKCTIE